MRALHTHGDDSTPASVCLCASPRAIRSATRGQRTTHDELDRTQRQARRSKAPTQRLRRPSAPSVVQPFTSSPEGTRPCGRRRHLPCAARVCRAPAVGRVRGLRLAVSERRRALADFKRWRPRAAVGWKYERAGVGGADPGPKQMMSVPVTIRSTVAIGVPTTLFDLGEDVTVASNTPDYDVSADGKRFVTPRTIRSPGAGTSTRWIFVQNALADFTARRR
jgi:hypothetical protein